MLVSLFKKTNKNSTQVRVDPDVDQLVEQLEDHVPLVPQPLCGQVCNPGQKKRKAAGGVHCLKLPLADLPELTCQNPE